MDTRQSALGIVARRRQQIEECDVIYGTDFITPKKLVKHLLNSKYESILFTWKSGLKEIAKSQSTKHLFLRLLVETEVQLLIADHLGLHGEHLIEESKLLQLVGKYWTTSKILFELYSENDNFPKPRGILHDLPNVTEIRRLRKNSKDRNGFIWIGNSKWGERYGFKDHKGKIRFILPIQEKLFVKYPNSKFRIFDSAEILRENDFILKHISDSKILFQTSESEGTGLPALEAMGLGVIPLTSNVGIAPELLTEELDYLICKLSTDDYIERVDLLLNNQKDLYNSLIEIFENHVAKVYLEKAFKNVQVNPNIIATSPDNYFGSSLSSLVNCKWFYRKLKYGAEAKKN